MSGKACKCGKALRKHANQQRVVATCPECKQPLVGSNGRKYPIHVVPVDVTLQQVTEWRNDGFTINIEQPSNND